MNQVVGSLIDLCNLSIFSILVSELICRPITPYLLPLALIIYPLFRATQTVRTMDESKVKSTLFTIMVIVWSFFIMNLPYALLLVTESSAQISQVSIDRSIADRLTIQCS